MLVARAGLGSYLPLHYDRVTQRLHLIDPLLVSSSSELCCLLQLISQEFVDKTSL